MPDQFDENSFTTKFKQKAAAKGFNMSVDRSELPPNTPVIQDLLEAIAEALDEIFIKDESLAGTIKAKSLKLGPTGLQQDVAYKGATVKSDASTDPKFWTWMETLHNLIKGPPPTYIYPEPGNGAPNVFAIALKALLALKPKNLSAKITDGSSSVKVTT